MAPKTNTIYWSQKIGRNVERDVETFKRLKAEGWLVIVLWEHENLAAKSEKIVSRVIKRRERLQKIG